MSVIEKGFFYIPVEYDGVEYLANAKEGKVFTKTFFETMMHRIPDAEVVNREQFLLGNLKDKKVVHLGCCGPFHLALEEICTKVWGVDIISCEKREQKPFTPKNFLKIDIEKEQIILEEEPDIILAGEIFEHLSNPGLALDNLHKFECPIIITVPNAFSSLSEPWLKLNIECINKDHVCYYSYYTMKNLVERHGYKVTQFFWYDIYPIVAQGLIFIIQKKG